MVRFAGCHGWPTLVREPRRSILKTKNSCRHTRQITLTAYICQAQAPALTLDDSRLVSVDVTRHCGGVVSFGKGTCKGHGIRNKSYYLFRTA